MRKIISYSLCLLLYFNYGQAQSSPVTWSFLSNKIADRTFQISLNAEVQPPWHIYSQFTPEGGPIPTKITFNKNPLLVIEGDVKEVGKVIKKYEDVFDMGVIYFDGPAGFRQQVKLKSRVKTTISGTIEYMVCNDTQCLPPVQLPFSITLQ